MPDFTGWLLEEAREYLSNETIRIEETAPPRLREGDELGQARILRWRRLPDGGEYSFELLVAREQISEARTAVALAHQNLKTTE